MVAALGQTSLIRTSVVTCMAAQDRVVAVAHLSAAALPGLHLGRVEGAADAPWAVHLRSGCPHAFHCLLRMRDRALQHVLDLTAIYTM